jgi:hypothetical protein
MSGDAFKRHNVLMCAQSWRTQLDADPHTIQNRTGGHRELRCFGTYHIVAAL